MVWALSVTTREEVTGLTGVQVAVQFPLPTGDMPSIGSPFEKLNETEPLVIGLPQLSTMDAAIGVGHATGLLKFTPSAVKIGSSCVGVQV